MPDKNRKKFVKSSRKILVKCILGVPSLLILLMLWVTFTAIGPTGQIRFPIEQRAAMNLGWVILLIAIVILVAPHLLYFFTIKRWPIAWAISAATLVGAASAVTISAFTIYLPERVVTASLETFFGVGIQLSLIVPLLFYKSRTLLQILAFETMGINVGWYVNKELNGDLINQLLPPSKRGVVVSMRTQGNYVEIKTTNGKHLQLGSLKKMCDLAPPRSGVRIHRSIWIRWDQITSLHYKHGNPHVTTASQEELPVSRNVVGAIKLYISELGDDSVLS